MPSVFISYSWDSPEHKDWVRQFAERLVANGIDVRLDQWILQPGQSLTQFMEAQVSDCEYVIVVCTPNYTQRTAARAGGVGYEQQIISGRLLAGVPREKFIPVVRSGEFEPGPSCAIPAHFAGTFCIDMRTTEKQDSELELLLRALFNRPVHSMPPLGNPPDWLTTGSSAEWNGEELRLAAIDFDGWELRSGLAQHQSTPHTFYLPPEEARQGLTVGDLVKLPFEIQIPTEDGDSGDFSTFGERMWVVVEGRVGPYYVGSLNNIPVTSDEQDNLFIGDTVVFLPEHVIDITSPDDAPDAEELEEPRESVDVPLNLTRPA